MVPAPTFLPPFLCQFHATETDAEQSRQKLEIFENSLPNETRWKTLVKNMQSSASCAYDHALEVLKRVENDRVNAKIAFSQVSMEQTPERNRSNRQMLITNALLTDLNAACLSQEDFTTTGRIVGKRKCRPSPFTDAGRNNKRQGVLFVYNHKLVPGRR